MYDDHFQTKKTQFHLSDTLPFTREIKCNLRRTSVMTLLFLACFLPHTFHSFPEYNQTATRKKGPKTILSCFYHILQLESLCYHL